MKQPLNYASFDNEMVVYIRFKIVPGDIGLVTEFNEEGIVAFGNFYKYNYLMDIAQWSNADWSQCRTNWNEFYTEE